MFLKNQCYGDFDPKFQKESVLLRFCSTISERIRLIEILFHNFRKNQAYRDFVPQFQKESDLWRLFSHNFRKNQLYGDLSPQFHKESVFYPDGTLIQNGLSMHTDN